MTSVAKKILEDALALPEEERRRLAERLLDTLGADASDQAAWTAEALRRANEVESGKGELLDLDESLGQLRADLRRARQA